MVFARDNMISIKLVADSVAFRLVSGTKCVY